MAKKEEALGRIVGAGEALFLLPVEDVEHVLDDVIDTLARVDAKRGRLQDQIAAACGRQRAPHQNRRAAPAAAEGDAQPAAAYTRKGKGAVRKRLRAAAGKAKEEKQRLEALWGELQEAIADARQSHALPPRAAA